eukprot:957634-Pleurochrysis_carterae.AAC.1
MAALASQQTWHGDPTNNGLREAASMTCMYQVVPNKHERLHRSREIRRYVLSARVRSTKKGDGEETAGERESRAALSPCACVCVCACLRAENSERGNVHACVRVRACVYVRACACVRVHRRDSLARTSYCALAKRSLPCSRSASAAEIACSISGVIYTDD